MSGNGQQSDQSSRKDSSWISIERSDSVVSDSAAFFQGSDAVSPHAAIRDQEMARILRQAQEPQYQGSDSMRIEINGVGSSDPGDYNRELIEAANNRGDSLTPTVANAAHLGLINDPSLMSYSDQMRNVGHFFGDLAIGAAKGLDNLIPETAALAHRMTGYAAAGVVSLFDTDMSDRGYSGRT
ncbi:hypothetical protein ACFOLJ_14875 [Rugamonas sp. CCM 8940]|uniref:hypothetical protein n=1 Tax=Rugamonas sp. CCM 8940 TaxID=2765359 RepID=UPI0018F5B177|nr:hypothetical protein [Rugamonas sp. CCM 8940]MBJ7310416.1 hypothetical protein [Rugamonas sp. CCM 8940]